MSCRVDILVAYLTSRIMYEEEILQVTQNLKWSATIEIIELNMSRSGRLLNYLLIKM